jgi:hypothetical protein
MLLDDPAGERMPTGAAEMRSSHEGKTSICLAKVKFPK